MMAFKGYSLLLKSSSTGSPIKKIYVSYRLLFPVMLVFTLLATLSTLSIVGFGKVLYHKTLFSSAMQNRNNLTDEFDSLMGASRAYQQRIDQIVEEDDRWRVTYGLPPMDKGMLRAGVGGALCSSSIAKENLEHSDIVTAYELREQFENYARQTNFIDSTLLRVKNHIKQKQARLRETPTIWPSYGNRTSDYGYRFHPILKGRIFHDGLDIANREWTPIIAPADGIVEKAHFSTGGYGKQIILSHPTSGYTTRYAHMIHMAVETGAVVKRGELLGYMGNTGRSTGSHLHYEIVRDGRKIDPEPFLLAQVPITYSRNKPE